MKKKKSMTGSFACKLMAFILLAVSLCVALLAGGACVYLVEEDAYSYSESGWINYQMEAHAQADIQQILASMEAGEWDYIQHWCESSNLDIEITRQFELDKIKTVVSDYTGYYTPYTYSYTWTDRDAEIGRNYQIHLYINPHFPVTDSYKTIYELSYFLYSRRVAIPVIAGGAALLTLLSFIFLMCSAGHKNGESGIVPSVLHPIPLDIVTAVFVIVAATGLCGLLEMVWYSINSDVMSIAVVVFAAMAATVWITLYCMELVTRMKLGKWWQNSVIYKVLALCGRILRAIGRGVVTLVKAIPMTVDVLALVAGISIIELICLSLWSEDGGVIVCWLLSKLVLIPLVIYLVMICRRLQEGSAALAEGNLSYRVDTKGMILGFKEHADNLNAVRSGMGIALEERMKSEHLKTELITNVSHDIKTPLTSIINYADLLGNSVMTTQPGEQLDRDKIVEYTDVLLRQSKRMKKLLEDLVEVSKATTGNLEVALAPCEIGVLLSQAVGEYEQRFDQLQLHLIVKQPEESVRILADGRHLWRIFDNLFNNICKYAQENSRVYVNVEVLGERVEITFRNMSRYVLDVTGKELEERFVRGDKSRHMEGSGLGLSIAKSLVNLQNGTMEIVTDGDLFKVILGFARLDGGEPALPAPAGEEPFYSSISEYFSSQY